MTSAQCNFMDFIEWLNKSRIPYFVAWGYEHLPDKISGGDVDLYVDPRYYMRVAEELTGRGYSSAKCPAYSHEHAHEQFAHAGYFTIHLFNSFCFTSNGKIHLTVISPDDLLQNRRWLKEMWIASPMVELLFTSLRMLGGRRDENCVNRLKKFVRETT